MQTAGHAKDQQNGGPDESSVEAAPGGAQALPIDQNVALQRYRAGHDCEGARCVCQRYENGELAVVAMGRMNRSNEELYQNTRGYSRNQNRQNFNAQPHNPELVVVLNRNRNGLSGENIYERLDNDDDEENAANNDTERNEPNDQNNGGHMYERIDNHSSYRGNRGASGPHNFQGSAVLWHALERRNRYDNPRDNYYLTNHACLNRLSGLSRNCFSTDNVALGATNNARHVYHLGHNCVCQFCTRLPFVRYHICQHCNSFHDRLRCSGNPTGPGSSRHYIYQVSRSCRCSYCRGGAGGEYSYARFPISASRLVESLRRDCQCRNPNNNSRILSTSNSAIYIGRVDRIGAIQSSSVNNPMYATICVGRIERSLGTNNQDGAAAASGDATNEPSTSSQASAALSAEAGPSTAGQAGPSNVLVCPVNNLADRQHTCDDSCIRNHSGNASGLCQFLGRAERSDCHGGRVSYHWWFVNRWLPSWGSQNDRNSEPVPRVEEPRDPQGSDTDES